MRSTFMWSAKMASNPATRIRSGTSVLTATVMTAPVATAVAAHPMKITGTRVIRTVPRWRMVSRSASYSVSRWSMDDVIPRGPRSENPNNGRLAGVLYANPAGRTIPDEVCQVCHKAVVDSYKWLHGRDFAVRLHVFHHHNIG